MNNYLKGQRAGSRELLLWCLALHTGALEAVYRKVPQEDSRQSLRSTKWLAALSRNPNLTRHRKIKASRRVYPRTTQSESSQQSHGLG